MYTSSSEPENLQHDFKLSLTITQLKFTYSKSTVETLEKGLKYIQS